MPKFRPERVDARAPRRFLIEGREEEEEATVVPSEVAKAESERAEMRRKVEKARRLREEIDRTADALLDRLEKAFDKELDERDLSHKIFEYVDAFDNEDWLWWLNYVLLTMDDQSFREELFQATEYSSEQESEEFNQLWHSVLYDFTDEERELLRDARVHGERYHNILEGAFEGFSEAWMNSEDFNPDELFKEIALLAWRPEIYYLPHNEERRAFIKEAEKFISLGTLNELLVDAANHGYHLARIGGVFDGKILARHALYRAEDEPSESYGPTFIRICDRIENCVYRTSGKHINFKPKEGWEIDIGPKSFGQKAGFEMSKKTDEDTWYWSLKEEPGDVKRLRELYLSIIPATQSWEQAGVWRLLPEGRYGFNIPPY